MGGRLSRRAKIVVVVDLFVLIVIIAVGFAGQPASTSPTPAMPPLKSSQGLTWIVAACGDRPVTEDLPQVLGSLSTTGSPANDA